LVTNLLQFNGQQKDFTSDFTVGLKRLFFLLKTVVARVARFCFERSPSSQTSHFPFVYQ